MLPILFTYVFGVWVLYLIRGKLLDLPWKIYWQNVGFYTFTINLTVPSAMTALIWICLWPFLLLFIRTALFLTTTSFCERGLWLFPRILEDDTYFGGFNPVYAWDRTPQISLVERLRQFKNKMKEDLGLIKRRGTRNQPPRIRRLNLQRPHPKE
jgi:hypothetical protein